MLASATPLPVRCARASRLLTANSSVVTEDADWGQRAGLRAAELEESLCVIGGRTPRQSTIPGYSDIWSDVWRRDDLGETWSQILANGNDTSWSGRAYFQTVVKDGEMLMIGGQDYRLVENPTDLS